MDRSTTRRASVVLPRRIQGAAVALVEPAEIRRIAVTAITAVASDDLLSGRLVLKGGNALQLIHNVGSRASTDLDFSMEGDLDLGDLRSRLEQGLRERFDAGGYEAFDFSFAARPSDSATQTWGGYTANVKVIKRAFVAAIDQKVSARLAKKAVLKTLPNEVRKGEGSKRIRKHVARAAATKSLSPAERLDALRPQAQAVRIEVSKYEYCSGKQQVELDGFDCFVYSPAMIAAEKVRAICQQMKEYTQRRNPTARARDFYDVHALVTKQFRVDLAQHLDLLRGMFAAKE